MKPLKVLIACEMSGTVRAAFTRLGHDATSCDIVPSETPGKHHLGDVLPLLKHEWDLAIAFPPCTHLCVSGARWFEKKKKEQALAISFFMEFANLKFPWAIENPIGIMSTHYRKPDQIIQPWQFGHGETKATCLWLNRLPKLVPTNIVSGREPRIHRMPPGPNRSRERSRTLTGIGNAMAEQWGEFLAPTT